MPGLSASEMLPETLTLSSIGRDGDALENPLQVSLDTGEALPLTNFMRRRRNSSGTILDVNQVSGANYVPISSNPGRSWRLRMPALFGRRCPSLSSLQSVQLLLR
ncbi:hypothetical protein Pcac1_g24070 [Phytophthora cactorum]|nr:hypothetical protein Pcac1_g24070 [Phytophthora cactorum]KAG3094086.1 hypothetical protein PC122_g5903 [Phytophthora cactorum]KAG3186734.1 hypothetical protein C6341_g3651 [Phytophthora cactorum]